MLTRRDAIKLTLAAGATSLLPPETSSAAESGKMTLRYFQAPEEGFRRTPVLLEGEREAILIDGGFTYSDGQTVAEAIKQTGKRLKTIFISCNDPDYYFGLAPIVAAFPDVDVLAKAATVEAIRENVDEKLKIWGPQLKENGPQRRADVTIPSTTGLTSLEIEGQKIEIIDIGDMHDRRYLLIPSLQAVIGGVLVSSGIHVWVADEARPEQRAAWVRALDEIASRNPKVVIPAHQTDAAPQGMEAVRFTRDYLLAFAEEEVRAADSAALIAAMLRRYPDLEDRGSLELGAKVVKGEMKWG